MSKKIPIILGIVALISVLLFSAAYSGKLVKTDETVDAVSQSEEFRETVDTQKKTENKAPKLQGETKEASSKNTAKSGSKNSSVIDKIDNHVAQDTVPGQKGDEARLEPKKQGSEANLWITRNFGRTVMFSKSVSLASGNSIMDILNKNLNIETAHGGSFVRSINGVSSGYVSKSGGGREKMDWLYWVNGVMASVGADQYTPGKGDVIWWDFHDWGTTMSIPAVIGAYPEPFLHGYAGEDSGAVILYTKGYEDMGHEIKTGLAKCGVSPIKLVSFNEKMVESRTLPTIVIGSWQEISKCKTISEFNERGVRSGLYAKLSDNRIDLLTHTGQVGRNCGEGCGVIVSVGAGGGYGNVLWLVTGSDSEGVREAARVLSQHPQDIRYCFGAAVDLGKVIPLPLE